MVILFGIVGGLMMWLLVQSIEPEKVVIEAGMSYGEIAKMIGSSNSVSYTEQGILRQWIGSGRHLVVMFDNNDVMLYVTHQFDYYK